MYKAYLFAYVLPNESLRDVIKGCIGYNLNKFEDLKLVSVLCRCSDEYFWDFFVRGFYYTTSCCPRFCTYGLQFTARGGSHFRVNAGINCNLH